MTQTQIMKNHVYFKASNRYHKTVGYKERSVPIEDQTWLHTDCGWSTGTMHKTLGYKPSRRHTVEDVQFVKQQLGCVRNEGGQFQ